MPSKGHRRTQAEYEREIKETAIRMQKHPEHLGASKSNKRWLQFLEDNKIIVQTSGEQDFWERVRKEIRPAKETEYIKYIQTPEAKLPTTRRLLEARVEVALSSKTGEPLTYKSSGLYKYRSIETGHFVSLKSINEGY